MVIDRGHRTIHVPLMKKALYILSELSDRDFEWILKIGELKAIDADQILIYEGQPVDAIYMVLEGTLAVTVRALSNTQVWAIPRTQLSRKLSQDSSFAANFYQAVAVWLSHRLRGTMSRLGYGYGYGKDLLINEHGDDATSPLGSDSDNFDIARIRLNWLLTQMKDHR